MLEIVTLFGVCSLFTTFLITNVASQVLERGPWLVTLEYSAVLDVCVPYLTLIIGMLFAILLPSSLQLLELGFFFAVTSPDLLSPRPAMVSTRYILWSVFRPHLT